MTAEPTSRVYFRQFLSGRDFARSDSIARQMVNYAYAIGDRATGECVLVDPAYAPGELVELVGADGMRVSAVLGSHYHGDHIGGSLMGFTLAGVAELLDVVGVKLHVQRSEAPWVEKTTGLGVSDLVLHDDGDVITVGEIPIEVVHTPGHTPGSQCFLVDGRLVAGDTLFLDGCGRTDLPGSDPSQMYDSLTRLARLPETTVVFPGHNYSHAPSDDLGSVKRTNYVFKPTSREAWLAAFAG